MSELSIQTVFVVAPDAMERARRVHFAMDLLRSRIPEIEVRRRVKSMFHCSKVTAWRTVDIARDLVHT